eukprot:scpid44628/ scgid1764/ OTU domain-containing protein 5-A; Deubiquitinating enzyme A
MTIKPVAPDQRSSSEDSSDGDASVPPPSRQPFHRLASQDSDTCSHSLEAEKCTRQKRRAKNRVKRPSPSQSQAMASTMQRGAEASGYNSSDEREGRVLISNEKEKQFEQLLLKELGFVIRKMRGDGACLFRAVAEQVYGDQEFHGSVRKCCMDYILQNADHFSQYLTEDVRQYVRRKSEASCFGNNIEIQAMSELFSRSIEVYQYEAAPINIFQSVYHQQNAPIRISYHYNSHYNAVIDPANPSFGVGLGLAGLEPGLADRSLLKDAYAASEQHELEETMLRNQMKASDWEATAYEMEQQVKDMSYRELFQDRGDKVADGARRKRRRSSPRTSPAGLSDDESYSPSKRPSPPSSPVTSLQSLQFVQKHQIALRRIRNENLLGMGAARPTDRSVAPSAGGQPLATARTSLSAAAASRAQSSCRASSVVSPRQSPSPPRRASQSLHQPACCSVSPFLAGAPTPAPTTVAATSSAFVGSSSSSGVSFGTLSAPGTAPVVASTSGSSTSVGLAVSSHSAQQSRASATVLASSASSVSAPRSPSLLEQRDAMVAADLVTAELLGASNAVDSLDEASILASVIAASQQEYFDQLRARGSSPDK